MPEHSLVTTYLIRKNIIYGSQILNIKKKYIRKTYSPHPPPFDYHIVIMAIYRKLQISLWSSLYRGVHNTADIVRVKGVHIESL